MIHGVEEGMNGGAMKTIQEAERLKQRKTRGQREGKRESDSAKSLTDNFSKITN